MKKLNAFFETNRRINLLLFLCSFTIYFLYFHSIFLNINSTLSSITADSLKNYYTYVYHIKNDPDFLHFTGMNYPYGEHIIYTDCQPILSFILRLLPFTHNWLIGIMHGLMFLSFIVSPLILNKILRLLDVDKFCSFLIALSIALLSPQFLKINAGHFALAYGCFIPLSILFTLKCLQVKNTRNFLNLFVLNTLLFFLHPYLGFCLTIFSFIALFLFEFSGFNKKSLNSFILILFQGFVPLAIFKGFMLLTDHHTDRTIEPFGAAVMVENIASIFSPEFGPFRKLMEFIFPGRTGHFEGHTYLGFFTIILLFLFLIGAVLGFKKLVVKKEMLVILIASFFFLLVSFGVHLTVLDFFHIQSASLNQFRAVCRFSWIFYFTLPLFLVSTVYNSLKDRINDFYFTRITATLALSFLFFNALEGNYFFKLNEAVYWKYRNFFHEDYLNKEEKELVAEIKRSKPQAILPLPLFHGGSEVYERVGSNNSMIPSMVYSYHTRTPIVGVLMSRTSLNETRDMIELFNSYKRERSIVKLIGAPDFFVLTTKDPLLPDETRLLNKVTQFAQNDTLKFGYISSSHLLRKEITKNHSLIDAQKTQYDDSTNIVFIPKSDGKAFKEANIMDYETVFVLDSNKVNSGTYVVSLHYYTTDNTYRGLAANLIINRSNKIDAFWEYNIPVRILSGFYAGFSVFEYRIELQKKNKYEFMIKGYHDQHYKISDFMLRPETLDVIALTADRDSIINNFPK